MATSRRVRALQELSSQIPVGNSGRASQLQAGRALQLQRAAGAGQIGGARGAQQAGAALAGSGAEAAIAGAQSEAAAQEQLGRTALTTRGREAEERIASERLGVRRAANALDRELNKLGEDVKDQLVDRQLQLQRDETGQIIWRERQLADFALHQAQSEEEFKNYAAKAQQQHSRKMAMMKLAHEKVKQVLEQGYIREKGDLTREMKERLIRYEVAAKNNQARAQAEAANRAAMWQAGWTVAGAGIGAVTPLTPVGGAAIGGAVGAVTTPLIS